MESLIANGPFYAVFTVHTVSHTHTHNPPTSIENVFQDTVIISSTNEKNNCIPSAALKAGGMGNTRIV